VAADQTQRTSLSLQDWSKRTYTIVIQYARKHILLLILMKAGHLSILLCLPLLCDVLLSKNAVAVGVVEARETAASSSHSRLIMRIEEYLYKSRDVKTSKKNRKRGRTDGMGDDGGSDDDDHGNRQRNENRQSDANHHNHPSRNHHLTKGEELEMILQRDLHEDSSIEDDAALLGDMGNDTSNGTSSPNTSSSAVTTSPLKTTTRWVAFPQRLVRRLRNTIWESLDDMDRLIVTTTLPIATLFCILPLVNAGDVFWVSRLGDTVSIAAQQASNQIYMSVFFLMNFLPSITAIQVSKSYASDDKAGTQDAICQALLLALFISSFGTAAMFAYPERFLSSILKGE
jgi:MatE